MQTHYRFGRILCGVVITCGCLAIGLGIALAIFGGIGAQNIFARGTGGLALVLWGAVAALLGYVARAIFDIADSVRRPSPPDARLDDGVPFPIARRDPG